jgi:glycosyltransferase involved in cell wall biosynthesis
MGIFGVSGISISIIIPTYNRATTIKTTIKSCLDQNIDEYEIIVVDDGSTDNTKEVVYSFDSSKVHYIYKEHSGAPEARNLGVFHAKGNYVLWIDSDDVFVPNVLSVYMKNIVDYPQVDVFYGYLLLMDDDLKYLRAASVYKDYVGFSKDKLISICLISNFIPNGGALVKKSLYEEYGGYASFFQRAQDYEFWSRVIETAKLKLIPKFVQCIRTHSNNLSSKKFDINYEVEVKKNMIKKYSKSELFPKLKSSKSEIMYEAIALLLEAYIMFLWGGFEESRDLIIKSLSLHEVARGYVMLGELYVLLKNPKEALIAFEKATALGMNENLVNLYISQIDHLEGSQSVDVYTFLKDKQVLSGSGGQTLDLYDLFHINTSVTQNKSILDVGFNPNLKDNWGKNAIQRTIIHPLADLYSVYIKQPNVVLQQSSYLDAKFSENSVDIVTCIGLLNVVGDPVGLINRYSRILKNDGIMYVSFDVNLPQGYGPFLPNNLTCDILDQCDMEPIDIFHYSFQLKGIDFEKLKNIVVVDKNHLHARIYAVLKKNVKN